MLITVKDHTGEIINEWHGECPPIVGTINDKGIYSVDWTIRHRKEGHLDSYDIDQAQDRLMQVVVTLKP